VRDVKILAASVMPNFSDIFTLQELADVVAYLGTLKAPQPAAGGRGNDRSGG
jgi:mono/diheme cytochrome c family protein